MNKVKVTDFCIWIATLLLFAGIDVLCWFEYHNFWLCWGAIFILIASMPLSSLLHEAGHCLFGLCSGIRAKISFTSALYFFKSSSCEVVPKKDNKVRARYAVTCVGGLALNLIVVIFGIIALLVREVPTYLALIAPSSLYLFLINFIPWETGSGKTDGLVIHELLINEDCAKVAVAVLTIQAKVLAGTPIEKVDRSLFFDLPQIREDDPAFIALTGLRADYFKALGDTAKAHQYSGRFEQLKADYLD